MTFERGLISQSCACLTCSATWEDVYRLAGYVRDGDAGNPDWDAFLATEIADMPTETPRTIEATPSVAAYRQAARDTYQCEGEIEIDDNAVVSRSDVGVYVAAWVWVHTPAGCEAEEA